MTPDTSSGYSGRPLVAKLGFKPGQRIKTVNAPRDYLEMVAPVPDGAVISDKVEPPIDAIHFFTASRGELEHLVPVFLKEMEQSGMMWISWPKKSSGVPSEITEDDIRTVALPLGLVDVKVCAVSAVWSGLKLMIRKEKRK